MPTCNTCTSWSISATHPPSSPSLSLSALFPFLEAAAAAAAAEMASTTLTPLPGYQAQATGSAGHRSGSLGPFFVVMSVILILTVFSCIFARVCASQLAGPDASYDCVGWTRRRWSRHRTVVREAKVAVAVAAAESEPSLSLPQP
ncbi:hypothetical protein Cni_G11627 [Canna indica]|uniref:Uncharacterized protein n=1 Tax=Canna indica TaxID=4628 RepID=A0AAQ3QBE3_9LILI|nr:hypothetical protein Cni_G11627 [Canna indica]